MPYHTIRGHRLFYQVKGDPTSPCLLFIHGANSSHRIWHHQFQDPSLGSYRLLALDLLGFGASDKPQECLELSNWILGIREIMDEEKLEQIHLVGHSNGVILAKEFYRNYPERVQSMLMVDGMMKLLLAEPMLAWMRQALEREDYEEFMLSNLNRLPETDLQAKDLALLKSDVLNTPKWVAKAQLDMITTDSSWEALSLSRPTSLLLSNNPMWSQNYQAWLASTHPHLKISEWPDARHFMMLQFPQRFAQWIRQHLSGTT